MRVADMYNIHHALAGFFYRIKFLIERIQFPGIEYAVEDSTSARELAKSSVIINRDLLCKQGSGNK